MADQETLTPRQRQLQSAAMRQMEGFLNKDLANHLANRVMQFKGNFDVLESALGALIVGQLIGWRVLTLIHSSRTMKKYQDVLELDFKGKLPWDPDQDVMPAEGSFARKSLAYDVSLKVGDFWKVVRGQTDEIRSSTERKTALPLSD